MRHMLLLRRRLVLATVAALVLSAGAYAYTASNTVPSGTAGEGSAAISGYSVSGVAYSLNAGTPTNIDAVSFTVSPAQATTVKMQLASGGAWYPCTNTSGSVSCSTTSPQATVGGVSQLSVVATQ